MDLGPHAAYIWASYAVVARRAGAAGRRGWCSTVAASSGWSTSSKRAASAPPARNLAAQRRADPHGRAAGTNARVVSQPDGIAPARLAAGDLSPSWPLIFAFALQQRRSLQAALGADRQAACPPSTLPALEGLTDGARTVAGFDSADLATGEVSVVNFWASWCVPCVQEHPLLVALKERTGVRALRRQLQGPGGGRAPLPRPLRQSVRGGRRRWQRPRRHRMGRLRHARDVHRQRQGRDRLQARRPDLARDAGRQDHSRRSGRRRRAEPQHENSRQPPTAASPPARRAEAAPPVPAR